MVNASASSVPIQSASSRSSSRWSGIVPLRKRDPVSAVPYVSSAFLAASLTRGSRGQAEVVVGAEHHPLGALHLHHRAGLALEQAEVRHHVVLARRAEQIEALVRARLLEEVGNGLRH